MPTTNRNATAGYFTDRPSAETAVRELQQRGYAEDEINTAHYASPAAGQYLDDPSSHANPGTLVTVGGERHADALPLLENAGAQTGGEVSTTLADEGYQRIKLHAEELSARKQTVQAGEVTLRKDVISETKSIDVPVTHEEVVIERHAVSGQTAAGATFQDETISVPVTAEQVSVSKDTFVTGEVSIGKREVTETEHLSGTVRHEELRVEKTGEVGVTDGAKR